MIRWPYDENDIEIPSIYSAKDGSSICTACANLMRGA